MSCLTQGCRGGIASRVVALARGLLMVYAAMYAPCSFP